MEVFLRNSLGSAFQELSFPGKNLYPCLCAKLSKWLNAVASWPSPSRAANPCWRPKSAFCTRRAYSILVLDKPRGKSCHGNLQSCYHLIVCSPPGMEEEFVKGTESREKSDLASLPAKSWCSRFLLLPVVEVVACSAGEMTYKPRQQQPADLSPTVKRCWCRV